MELELVIRRNRRRLVLLTLVAASNYWLIASFLAGFFGWSFYFKLKPEADVSGWIVLGVSAGLGALIAAETVRMKLERIRPRTIDRLGAVDIEPSEFPVVENLLEGLAIATGTPPVRAALVDDPAPNALAVGRRPSETTIVITTGLVEVLTRDELESVLAVEMCAIRRLDTALATVTLGCTAGAVAAHRLFREDGKDPRSWFMLIATWPTMAIAEMLRRSVLRSTDFGADEMALTITRHPEALELALRKLAADRHEIQGGRGRRSGPLVRAVDQELAPHRP